MATTIARSTWTDGANGTIINNARLQADIYDPIDALFTVATFVMGGKLTVEGFGAHTFSAGGTGPQTLVVQNSTAGTGNYAAVYAKADGALQLGILMFSSSFTAAGNQLPSSGSLETFGTGGLSIAATNAAGAVRFSSGGVTERARLHPSGGLSLGDATDPGAANLRVTGSATVLGTAAVAQTGAASGYPLVVRNDRNTLDDTWGLSFNEPGAGARAAIRAVNMNTGNNTGRLDLAVGNGLAALPTFVSVFADGGVSIGDTTSPGPSRLRVVGKILINDTVDSNVTNGLTINQGTSAGYALTLKEGNVAHGHSGIETDTYGACSTTAGAGGLILSAWRAASADPAMNFQGLMPSGSGTTAKTIGAQGWFSFHAYENTTALGADKNIAIFASGNTTRFILDADGDSHQDTGTAWTNFDIEDDVAILELLTAHVTRKDDPLRASFGEWLQQSREPLERLKLVSFDDANGHHFVNMSRLTMLLTGALRQVHQRLEHTELTLKALTRRA